MRLIDTFLLSQPHEDDLLYLKLQLEAEYVDCFIIQQSKYSLQGILKGLWAEEILKQERFKPYLEKIFVVSNDTLICPDDRRENTNFQREGFQRTLFVNTPMTFLYNDILIVSDVDEMLDLTDETRRSRFFALLNKNHDVPFWINRMRYWYDYDNRCYLRDIRIPIVPISLVSSQGYGVVPQSRHWHDHAHTYYYENPIAFEYSYVFRTLDDLWQKKQTYAHTNFTVESLEEGLRLNAWPRPKERGESRSEHDFFEKVELTEENSPRYVRDNIDSLRTNIVNKEYKSFR